MASGVVADSPRAPCGDFGGGADSAHCDPGREAVEECAGHGESGFSEGDDEDLLILVERNGDGFETGRRLPDESFSLEAQMPVESGGDIAGLQRLSEDRGHVGVELVGGCSLEAGLIPVADCGLYLFQLTCKKVVGTFDPDHLRRLFCGCHGGGDLFSGAVLVAGSADEEFWHGAGGQEAVAVVAALGVDGEAEGDRSFDARVGAGDAQADVRAEGKSGEEDRQALVLFEPVEGGADVVLFAAPVVMGAFAEAGSAEVEAQDGQAEGLEGLHGVIDDFVVHGSSTERVRVAEEDGVFCLGRASVEQGFETARGAGEVLDGSDSGGVHLLA